MRKTLGDLSRDEQIVASLAHLNSFEHPSESAALVELARGKTVLEIGTFQGYSAILMSRVAKVVHTVDWHRGGHELGEQDTLATAWTNIQIAGAQNVVLHVGRSEDVLPVLRGPFELIFIDGSHEYEDVKEDIFLCYRLGRQMLFHDYRGYPGVTQAVDEFVRRLSITGATLERIAGTLAMVTLGSDIMHP